MSFFTPASLDKFLCYMVKEMGLQSVSIPLVLNKK